MLRLMTLLLTYSASVCICCFGDLAFADSGYKTSISGDIDAISTDNETITVWRINKSVALKVAKDTVVTLDDKPTSLGDLKTLLPKTHLNVKVVYNTTSMQASLVSAATNAFLKQQKEQELAAENARRRSGMSVPANADHSESAVPRNERRPATPGEKRTTSGTSSVSSPVGSSAVTVDGIGSTSEEALKDALRNAVMQAVGAIVDAETLVKDDSLIKDQVLTYSDGFVNKYEVVPGSKAIKDGIYHITIIANVERRTLAQKLKAANVTIKDIDGTGLFAEAITQLEAEKNAEQLLRKALSGFPSSLVTARVIGDELVDQSETAVKVRYKVRFEVDLKAYDSFISHIQPILDAVAKEKGVFTAEFMHQPRNEEADSFAYHESTERYFNSEARMRWMPKGFVGDKWNNDVKLGHVVLALATQRPKKAGRLEYRYYLLDKTLQSLFGDLVFRSDRGRLSLVDQNGSTVKADSFPLLMRQEKQSGHWDVKLVTTLGWLAKNGTLYVDDEGMEVSQKKDAVFFLISPVFFAMDRFGYVASLELNRTISLSLNELKSIKEARCEFIVDDK